MISDTQYEGCDTIVSLFHTSGHHCLSFCRSASCLTTHIVKTSLYSHVTVKQSDDAVDNWVWESMQWLYCLSTYQSYKNERNYSLPLVHPISSIIRISSVRQTSTSSETLPGIFSESPAKKYLIIRHLRLCKQWSG